MSINGWLLAVRRIFVPEHRPSVPPDVMIQAARKMEIAADVMNRRVDEIVAHPHPLEELMRRMQPPARRL